MNLLGHDKLLNNRAIKEEAIVTYDGQVQFVGRNSGYIYKSVDYGVNWEVVTSLGSSNWISIAISGTGQYVMASDSSTTYQSSDYGNTWSSIAYSGRLSMSASGAYRIITQYGYPNVSTDYGQTWSNLTAAGDDSIQAVGMSFSNTYIVLGHSYSGYLIRSTNGGSSFTDITSPGLRNWTRIATGRWGMSTLSARDFQF